MSRGLSEMGPPPPFNYDSFHFPSWILTRVWSSSHPLPSHLFAFKDIAKSATFFLISAVKISQILPEIMQPHTRFPALHLPLLSHNVIHKVIATLDLPEHTVQDRRYRVSVVFLRPRPWQAGDSPGVVPSPSCPLQAFVRFNRLRSCRGETGSQRG